MQDSTQRKRLVKEKLDCQGDEESRPEYREARCAVKREVAKEKADIDLYKRLETKEG